MFMNAVAYFSNSLIDRIGRAIALSPHGVDNDVLQSLNAWSLELLTQLPPPLVQSVPLCVPGVQRAPACVPASQ